MSSEQRSSESYQPELDKITQRTNFAGTICLLAALVALITTIVNSYADLSEDAVKMVTYLFYAAVGVVGVSYVALIVLFTKKGDLVRDQNIASARERRQELDVLKAAEARSHTLQGSVENLGVATVEAAGKVYDEAKESVLGLMNRLKGKKSSTNSGMTYAQQNVLLGGLSNPFYMA